MTSLDQAARACRRGGVHRAAADERRATAEVVAEVRHVRQLGYVDARQRRNPDARLEVLQSQNLNFFHLAFMGKIDIPHQRVLAMILQNSTLVMVKIQNKVKKSFVELCHHLPVSLSF